jgi:hypothetical protein
MKTQSTSFPLLTTALSLFALACGSSNSGPQAEVCVGANIKATAASNYTFTSDMKLPPVTVKSMSNLTFDWSGVTHDFKGHPLSATQEVNTVSVMMWTLPLEQLQSELNADVLQQSDLVVVPPPSLNPAAGVTSAMLYDFTLNGSAVTTEEFNRYFDPVAYPSSRNSFMVALATGTTIGEGFRMLQSFEIDPTSSATTIHITNDSTQLTYSANLHSLAITGVPAATPGLMLDWSDLVSADPPDPKMPKNNALGNEFKDLHVTDAIVGHYTQTPAELEKQFLDLDLIATDLYRAKIESGTVLDFTTLMDKDGKPFPGVTSDGTWLVGLTCGVCRNPAPWYMTILKPCAATTP